MAAILSRQIVGILKNIKSNQVLVYIGDEMIDDRVRRNLIIIRDSSPSGLEEVLMALQESRLEPIVLSDNKSAVADFRYISTLVKGILNPIVDSSNLDLEGLPIAIRNGKVSTMPNTYSKSDYILLTRAFQLIGKLNISYCSLNKYDYLRILETTYKCKIMDCIDWILGYTRNDLKRLYIRDTAQFISSIFDINNSEYVYNLITPSN